MWIMEYGLIFQYGILYTQMRTTILNFKMVFGSKNKYDANMLITC